MISRYLASKSALCASNCEEENEPGIGGFARHVWKAPGMIAYFVSCGLARAGRSMVIY
jgi:hypothetical protein